MFHKELYLQAIKPLVATLPHYQNFQDSTHLHWELLSDDKALEALLWALEALL
jgi:hypothetical protein